MRILSPTMAQEFTSIQHTNYSAILPEIRLPVIIVVTHVRRVQCMIFILSFITHLYVDEYTIIIYIIRRNTIFIVVSTICHVTQPFCVYIIYTYMQSTYFNIEIYCRNVELKSVYREKNRGLQYSILFSFLVPQTRRITHEEKTCRYILLIAGVRVVSIYLHNIMRIIK